MSHVISRHAAIRAQQRGITPMIQEYLLEYGAEIYDGHGGIRRYFDKRSIRCIERDLGRELVCRIADSQGVFLIESSHDSSIITVGHRHRTKRMHRN